jgi:hypothetical protein
MSTVQQSALSVRQCVYSGKPVANHHSHCPHCREAVPKVRLAPSSAPATKGGQIRRGFLYMILGLIVRYVASRADGLNLPISVNPTVSYLAMMLLLGGLALTLYGFFAKVTA